MSVLESSEFKQHVQQPNKVTLLCFNIIAVKTIIINDTSVRLKAELINSCVSYNSEHR